MMIICSFLPPSVYHFYYHWCCLLVVVSTFALLFNYFLSWWWVIVMLWLLLVLVVSMMVGGALYLVDVIRFQRSFCLWNFKYLRAQVRGLFMVNFSRLNLSLNLLLFALVLVGPLCFNFNYRVPTLWPMMNFSRFINDWL